MCAAHTVHYSTDIGRISTGNLSIIYKIEFNGSGGARFGCSAHVRANVYPRRTSPLGDINW